MTDPIADMLTRIRNAVRIERPYVDVPISKVKRGVAEVLKREGYIWDWQELEAAPIGNLRIELKYGPNGERVIQRMRRVSTPGRRVYSRCKKLRPVWVLPLSVPVVASSVIEKRDNRTSEEKSSVKSGNKI